MLIASRYADAGFIGPFRVYNEDRIARLRSRLAVSLVGDEQAVSMRHLKSRELYELCVAPPLLDVVQEVLGGDLLLWRSRLFVKEPGGTETPWHTDAFYFTQQLQPVVNATAWIALDDVTRENACLKLIPGSHQAAVTHVSLSAPVDRIFFHEADPAVVDNRAARYLEMRAGECVVFNESLLHGSTPNTSPRRRMGLSVRFTVPSSRIKGKNLGAILVRGHDSYQLNTLVAPPPSLPEAEHSPADGL